MKNSYQYNHEYPHTVVLIKAGVFYRAFDAAALVLSAITGYQVIEQKNNHARCGFCLSAIEQVKQQLIQHGISYVELWSSHTNTDALEVVDAYEQGTAANFNDMLQKGRIVTNARRQAAEKISSIQQQTTPLYVSASLPLENESPTSVSKEWLFIDSLCRGVHPFHGKSITQLDLNDPDIIRALYSVRDLL